MVFLWMAKITIENLILPELKWFGRFLDIFRWPLIRMWYLVIFCHIEAPFIKFIEIVIEQTIIVHLHSHQFIDVKTYIDHCHVSSCDTVGHFLTPEGI